MPLLGRAAARAATARSHRRRRVVVGALAVVFAAGVWILIGQVVHFGKLAGELRRANPAWFVVCLATEALSYVAFTFLYRPIVGVRGGPRPSFGTALRINLAVFGAFVLGSSAGNLAIDYWALRRMRQTPAEAAAQVIAINAAQWALLTLLTAGAALALLAGAAGHAPLAVELPWLVALPVCLPAALWVSAYRRRALADHSGSNLRRGFAAAVRSLIMLRSVFSKRSTRWSAIVGGIAFWAARIATAWAALRAFGVTLGAPAVTVAYATGYAATMLPLPIGGVGGVDAARTYALTLVGVPLSSAALGTFAARVFSFWLPIVPVLLAARSINRLRADLPRVPRSAPATPPGSPGRATRPPPGPLAADP